MEEAYKPRNELVLAIARNYSILEKDRTMSTLPPHEILALSVVTEATSRIEAERWLPATALSVMRQIEKWAESEARGTTTTIHWQKAKLVFSREHHEINKAPLLNLIQIRAILSELPNDTFRAIFWFALLACARLGNLAGVVVEQVTPTFIMYTWALHKTSASVGARSISLYYWNTEMAASIYYHLPRGRLSEEICMPLTAWMNRLGVRLHSARRTGVQVYVDAGLSLEKVMTITLHKTKEALLGYVSYYNPLGGPGHQGGIAVSLAPTILHLVRQGLL